MIQTVLQRTAVRIAQHLPLPGQRLVMPKRSLSNMSGQHKNRNKQKPSKQKDPNPDQPPPNVVLTWELSKERPGHATISLQPLFVSASAPDKTGKLEPESVATAESAATPASAAEADATAKGDGREKDVVPDSVLQYQRQVRKAQHTKKAGIVLTPDQLEVVYQDDNVMMLVNKPPGVLTVPGVNSNSSLLSLVHDKIFGASTSASTATDSTTAATDSATRATDSTAAATDTSATTDTTATSTPMNPASMIVHRLDMDTSGLVLFSLNLEITKLLHASFANRNVEKEYDAVLMGHFPVDIETAVLDLPLQRDHEHPPFMRVSTPTSEQEAAAVLVDLHAHGWKKLTKKRPKPSQTELKVVERGWKRFGGGDASTTTATTTATTNNESGIATTTTTTATAAAGTTSSPAGSTSNDREQWLPYTRVRLTPITGRTHQLRVHCAALGYPIVGDPTYSLYGEAAPTGGLQDCPVSAAVAPAPASASAEGNDDETNDEKKKNKNNETMSSLLCKSRPSLDIQKAWTAAYPPNVEPMCLHAAMLQIHHPVTGELLTWEVPPKFGF